MLGYIIFSSSGFNLDNEELVKKARSHFKKAIQCGHVEAIYQLAQTYSNDFGPLYETLHHYMLMGRYYEAKGNSVKADEYYGKGLDCYKSSFDDLAAVYKAIKEMYNYGAKKDNNKGQIIKTLAVDLEKSLDDFIKKSYSRQLNINYEPVFLRSFNLLIHSKDDVLGEHEQAWKPIVANILIALTGVGLLALLTKTSLHLWDVAVNKEDFSFKKIGFFAETSSQKIANKAYDIVTEELDKDIYKNLEQ